MSSTGEDRETITIKYNKCHQMSSSTSAHQSWVTAQDQSGQCPIDIGAKYCDKSLKFYFLAARNLVCFSHSTGDQTKDCDQTRGFKTCFTRYNSGNRLRIKHEVDSPCNIEKLVDSGVKRTFGVFLVGHLRTFPKNMFKLLQQTS